MPKYNQPRKTWQYSNEFKVKAVQLSLLCNVQVKDVAYRFTRTRQPVTDIAIAISAPERLRSLTGCYTPEITSMPYICMAY
jgi:hypothetical protein